MNNKKFIHELDDISILIERIARDIGTLEQLVEKDYWITHCLWGLKNQGFKFELKGGTSLSKGFGIINRFSEDIDIRIYPPDDFDLKCGKNQNKPSHIKSRLNYFDWLAKEISIPSIITKRDSTYDDKYARNGAIQLLYDSRYSTLQGVKPFVLLEVGFDVTTPNFNLNISSWLNTESKKLNLDVFNNDANNIACYHPGYTFIEKLSAISLKYQKEQSGKIMPVNFIRHYYDIYKLLEQPIVKDFIGTSEYTKHKATRFTKSMLNNLQTSDAFFLRDPTVRERYRQQYERTNALYYNEFPDFDEILDRIGSFMPSL
jgi:hypothetical protein